MENNQNPDYNPEGAHDHTDTEAALTALDGLARVAEVRKNIYLPPEDVSPVADLNDKTELPEGVLTDAEAQAAKDERFKLSSEEIAAGKAAADRVRGSLQGRRPPSSLHYRSPKA